MNDSQRLLLIKYIDSIDAETGLLLLGVDELNQLIYVVPIRTGKFYMDDGELKFLPMLATYDHSEIKAAFR